MMSKLSLIAVFVCAMIFGSANAFVASNNGRRSSSLHMTVLTSTAGKKIDVKEGTPLKAACAKLGVKPKFSCKR